jgi:hypothetical protein
VARTLTDEHKAAMQAGRKRALSARQRHAVQRVEAYRAWVKRGSPVTDGAVVPEIPSDGDYATWRETQKPRG